MNFCPKCGAKRNGETPFCTACGYKYGNAAPGARRIAPATQHPRPRPAVPPASEAKITLEREKKARKKKSSSLVMTELEEKYKVPLVLITIVMVAGIIMFSVANYRNPLLEKPVELMVLDDGGCILASTRGLARYNAAGDTEWKLDGAGDNPFDSLVNFEFGKDGNLYVANPYRATIEVITPEGEWRRTIETGTRDSNFAMSVLPDGNLLVADARGHRLKLFSPDGRELKEIGQRGVGPYDLRFPNGIAIRPDGRVLIVDTNNQRFQVLDRDMKLYNSIPFPKKAVVPSSASDEPVIISYEGAETKISGVFFGCQAVADHSRGRVYVSFADDLIESPYGYIAIFDMDGNYIDRSMMEAADGRNIYAYTLKMTPDGKVSVADVDEYTAGTWDPETGRYTETDNPGVLGVMGSMKEAATLNKTMYNGGIVVFGACFVFVIGLVSYVQRKEESSLPAGDQVFGDAYKFPGREKEEFTAAMEFIKSRMSPEEELRKADRMIKKFIWISIGLL